MAQAMARRLRHILAINFVIALGVLLIYFGFGLYKGAKAEELKWTILGTIIYSNCIGSLASIIFSTGWPCARRLRYGLHWLLYGVMLVVVTAAGCLIAGLIFMALGMPSESYWTTFLRGFKGALAISFTFGIGVAVYEELKWRLDESNRELRRREQERERALTLATEARLASLESRIHPHFLFNTLNSISSLIRDDPEKAERMVERIAALLRYSLDAREGVLVPLHSELKIAVDYLEIEKTRFGDRLRYSIDVPDGAGSIEVPPFSVQTLVENSVKHAIAPRREGGEVRISVRKSADRLQIEVFDDGPGFEPSAISSGHGLDNLRTRLAAVFGSDAGLSVSGSTVSVFQPAGRG